MKFSDLKEITLSEVFGFIVIAILAPIALLMLWALL